MGKIPVGGSIELSREVVKVLNGTQNVEFRDVDYVDFVTTGAPAQGAFHCSACGYGVTVQTTLPRCPMCNGTTWERWHEHATSPG